MIERKRLLFQEIDGGRRRRNRTGVEKSNIFYVIYGRSVMSAHMMEASLFGVGISSEDFSL